MGKKDPEPEPQSHDQWLADQFSSELNQLDWANMTPEEIAEAQAALQLMGEEYGEDWQIGQSIGTVPNTPWGTEGDTGEHESVRKR